MNKKELEKRSYTFETRAENTEGEYILTGRPIVYNSKTDMGYFDEIIEPGALNNADLTDVRFLVNHDISKIPLARSRNNNGNSTMKLTTDNEGLNIDFIKLDCDNNADARALYSAVEREDISGMSFMFSVTDEEWEDLDSEHPTRRIKEIGSVVEISAVTFPAYDATEINARSKDVLENARKALDSAKESRGTLDSDKLELEKLKIEYLTK